ncbi:MAG: 3-deoxy-7-phosphoheptulonate synthase [Gammaproteobacteria bacterium]|nr:MAG: 3-deoxy-7-phosphoheptulonate synthase [Gammaproteobacteria bacterium]
MIIHLKNSVTDAEVEKIAKDLDAFHIKKPEYHVLVTPSALQQVPAQYESITEASFAFPNDMQLASADYFSETREIDINGVKIGADHNNTLVIAGPCSVESEEQITQSAELMVEQGISTLRAGCYKPRTSPYSFQGMGIEGLKLLDKMRSKFGLNIITEVRDTTHVDEIIDYADIIQIGAKAMYDQGILRTCGKSQKPILLKRGFGTTLQEFVQAAEFILSAGNDNVILCERGIRTFETKTRFTLDLCGVAYLKEYTNLPIILDPSHALGYRYGVPDLARACTAMGIEGLLIEVHPDPSVAKSDAAQQLDHNMFRDLLTTLRPIATAVGRTII